MPSQTAVVLPVRRKQSTRLRCVEEGNDVDDSEREIVNRGKVWLWWVFSRALVLTRNTKSRARNHTQRADFPPPTAEQGSNDVKSGGNYVTIPARGLPLNLIAKISNFYQRSMIAMIAMIASGLPNWL